ncbi:MAG: hypothetical protein JXM70_22385 [Pirellulales bacterium]|nr:hypothetical protein [Pirellulales bacterium]
MSSMRLGMMLFCFSVFGLCQGTIFAAEKIHEGSGLEVDKPWNLPVIIKKLDDDTKKMGLSEALIREKIERQLDQHGIKCVPWKDVGHEYYLYVEFTAEGRSFSISLKFNRLVSYVSKGRTYRTYAATWYKSVCGTYRDNLDFIINGIMAGTDIFLKSYHKANPPDVEPSGGDGSP